MPAAWRAPLAALPEVLDVDAFRVRETLLDGEICFLGAGETRVLAKHGYLPLVDGSDPRPLLARTAGGRNAFISEPLARRRHLASGDSVVLDTPTGRHRYAILAVYRDYASDRGYIVLDRETYLADFRDSLVSTYALYLRPGVTPERAAAAGLLLGALTGALLSAVLVHVLNRESFGWTLTLATPWRRTLLLAAFLFVAALLAAVPPARRAASIPPREAMSRA